MLATQSRHLHSLSDACRFYIQFYSSFNDSKEKTKTNNNKQETETRLNLNSHINHIALIMWHCVYSFLKAVVRGDYLGSLFDTCYVHYCCESLYFVSIKLIIIIKNHSDYVSRGLRLNYIQSYQYS